MVDAGVTSDADVIADAGMVVVAGVSDDADAIHDTDVIIDDSAGTEAGVGPGAFTGNASGNIAEHACRNESGLDNGRRRSGDSPSAERCEDKGSRD